MIGSAPHMGEANIRLTCERPTGNFISDAVGNSRPEVTEEIILLSLREDKESRMRPSPEGGNIKQSPMIGRTVNPKILPIWISTKKRYKAEKLDLVNSDNQPVIGEFEFDIVTQHRDKTYTELRGSLVKGFFIETN